MNRKYIPVGPVALEWARSSETGLAEVGHALDVAFGCQIRFQTAGIFFIS
jgi:hypothetical protein